MPLIVYLDDDETLVEDLPIGNFEVGEDSTPVELHIWNPEGGQTLSNIQLLLRTAHLSSPNTWLAIGVPPQDELWGRIRVIGFDNAGDPTWSTPTTDWMPQGASAALLLASIPGGCAVYVEHSFHPPRGASPVDYRFKLVGTYAEFSLPVPLALTMAVRGILTGVGDLARSGLISGLGVTASGSPDDLVTSAAGFWLHRGILYGDVAREHQFDDEDAAAEALEAGEHYLVVQSRGAGVVNNTKGLRGAAPAAPAMPAGDVFIRYIRVDYQVGGTPVIEAADLSGETLYDRYLAVAGSGLNLEIHPGYALGGSTLRLAAIKQLVPLTDDDVNYVWQLANGQFQDTVDLTPPSLAATPHWFEVTTAGGVITDIVDRRTYAGGEIVLHLRGAMPGSVGLIDTLIVSHELLYLEQVRYRLSGNGGGGSGQTQLDTELAGDTIYTDFAVDDQRPAFAFDAAGADLVVDDGVHQVTALRKGQELSLVSLEYPAGSTPGDVVAEAWFICRLP
jgi:hypothetical protein